MILGIDPGPVESAYCLVDREYRIVAAGKVSTTSLLNGLRCAPPERVAVESIQSYGMVVGRSVFDTCYVIGRIQQVCDELKIPCVLYPRQEYLRRICGGSHTKDSILRRSLALRFGGYGETVSEEVIPAGVLGAGVYMGGPRKGQARRRKVRTPEPLHILNCTDLRSAFAVAVYHIDLMKFGGGVVAHG
jgi:hypothetical protein